MPIVMHSVMFNGFLNEQICCIQNLLAYEFTWPNWSRDRAYPTLTFVWLFFHTYKVTSKSVRGQIPLSNQMIEKSADPWHNEFRHLIGHFPIWLIYWLDILVWHFAGTTFSGFQRILSTSKGHKCVSTFTPFIQR